MSNMENLASVLNELHARIVRLEVSEFAMYKAMAAEGQLPKSFPTAFAEEASLRAQADHEGFRAELTKLVAQWQPMIDQISGR
ncbi:TPA: hypothetical protein QDZ51_003120 [Stenotrophomonas maltophilia]|uniref:hypothetical protein n=1 Tax=Stenotrophomonas maltophilia TaxID=40324 RepID=UPI000F501A7F|nr:hypothetical protein [Stenotrophomonas maltophilia]AYZ69776.1 hypothetical protein EGY09_07150 [Stenotrophomonas maltophilia]HDS1013233.1 hypothetical protein [Stenotrophomonas maltophilia]HDS1022261.1 hypothetical protein [Stenotrophomonas maltophilia]